MKCQVFMHTMAKLILLILLRQNPPNGPPGPHGARAQPRVTEASPPEPGLVPNPEKRTRTRIVTANHWSPLPVTQILVQQVKKINTSFMV